jgi:hypothetical protein
MSRTRHPLKAYLSDIQPDQTERHTRAYQDYTADAAVAEAKAILSETEPRYDAMGTRTAHVNLGLAISGHGPWGRNALADALAAFVADGDRQ